MLEWCLDLKFKLQPNKYEYILPENEQLITVPWPALLMVNLKKVKLSFFFMFDYLSIRPVVLVAAFLCQH